MIALTDAQLALVFAAANAVPYERRDGFLRALAAAWPHVSQADNAKGRAAIH